MARRSARRATARVVVLSAGAIETARLLLASGHRSIRLASATGMARSAVNLQGHYYPTAFGLFDHDVYDPLGPGVTIATCEFNHGNAGIIGGGMLADDFIMLPVIFWSTAMPPELRRWGTAAKDFMRQNYRRVIQVKGPVHEIPSPDCKVDARSAGHATASACRWRGCRASRMPRPSGRRASCWTAPATG